MGGRGQTADREELNNLDSDLALEGVMNYLHLSDLWPISHPSLLSMDLKTTPSVQEKS